MKTILFTAIGAAIGVIVANLADLCVRRLFWRARAWLSRRRLPKGDSVTLQGVSKMYSAIYSAEYARKLAERPSLALVKPVRDGVAIDESREGE